MTARTIFGVWLGAFLLSYFFRSANAVIAADLRVEFALDAAQLGLMTSTFFASIALAQLPLGAALDRWGPRRVVSVSMLAAVAGALVFAGADTFRSLALGRALLGLGFAGVLMGALQSFSRWFPDRRFATVSGLLVGLGTSGALLAGTPLAWLAETVGWRTVFAGGSAVVLLAAATIFFGTRDAPPADRAATTGTPLGSFGDLLRDHRFWRIAFMNLFAIGSLLAVQGLWAGPYLVDAHGLPTVRIGDLIAVMALGVVIGNLASGALADRFGRGPVALLAGTGFTGTHAALALAGAGTPIAFLTATYFAFGALGSFGAVLFAEARAIAPAHLTGRTITAINLAGIAGAVMVQWLMGAIIEFGRDATGAYGTAAYRPAFLLTTAIGIVALLIYAPHALRRGTDTFTPRRAARAHTLDRKGPP
jgi:nitrate/nitrite transporter NarK